MSHFDGPEESPGFLLWKVTTVWRRLIESALSTLDLTHPQFVLLASSAWLTQDGTQVTQAELARHCKMDLTMTSQVLRTLERKGLIKRQTSEKDERSKFSYPTKNGSLLIGKALPLVESIDKEFFGKLGKDLKHCIEILQKL